MGVLSGLTSILMSIAQAFGGPFGIALVSVGLAGTAAAVIWFHAPMSWLWKAAITSVILLGAGSIASSLAT